MQVLKNWIEKKTFYLFIIVNLILWVAVESLRNIISRDSMEAIVWGNLLSVGTNKHPPLSGWLAGGFFGASGDHNVSIYLLGALCVSISLIFTYKLAKNFLSSEKAICSSLLLTASFYYTFQLFYDNFNCNILSMPLWSMLSYYFYKATTANKLKHWLILGLVAGLAFLAKYQVVLLFLGMFIYLLLRKRECFRQKNMYIAGFVALLIVLPHIFWLAQNDFFPFEYLIDRTTPAVFDSKIMGALNRITVSLKFFADQLLSLAPCFVIYAILAIKERNIKFDFHKENKDNSLYLICTGLLPLVIIGLSGLFTSSRVVGAWGVAMVGSIGILLFYFFPVKISENTYKLFAKLIITVMLLWQLAMAIFALLQVKVDMGYPYKKVLSDFNSIWAENVNNRPLKYVAGDIYYIFQFELYSHKKTRVILETYGHKNPWADPVDVVNSGILVISQNKKELMGFTKGLLEIFPEIKKEDFEIKEYSYDIVNKINRSRTREFYYLIIPPRAQ